ncbi:MAG: ACP synthase [Acidobacteria bacterium]|nr:MAG: ACP synthase [Acidobacteriota bacterium]
MDILGIGTDIVECARILRMIERHGDVFLRRVFTEHEIRYCQSKKRATEHFAGRWAAKEAILKSIGTGLRKGINWTDLEVHQDDLGKPQVRVGGTAREVMRQLHVVNIYISISHCRAYATAYALAVRKPAKEKRAIKEPEEPDTETG